MQTMIGKVNTFFKNDSWMRLSFAKQKV